MTLALPTTWQAPLENAATTVLDDVGLREDIGAAKGLKLHYQPIVDVTGAVVCVEALLRMTRLGVLVPAPEVINQARRLGVLHVLGSQVQRVALGEFATHCTLKGFPRRLSINVAPEEFTVPGFADSVLAQIDRCNLVASQVTLEITEDSPLPHTAEVAETMRILDAAGVRLSLDDFGTGNNGFHSLLRMRFQQVKFDKVYVDRLHTGGHILLRGLIQTAKSMGLEIVCEGVETADQAKALRDLGCDLLQGYYFGKPAELDQLKSSLPSS